MNNVAALKQPEDSGQLEKLKDCVNWVGDDEVLASIPFLAREHGDNAFKLGGYLARIKDEKLWAQEFSFVEWLEHQDISKSRGYELIKTYKAIASHDLPPDIIERIGWSKLCLIVPRFKTNGGKLAAKSNAAMIQRAEDSSQLELRKWIAEIDGKKAAMNADDHAARLKVIMKKCQPEDVLEVFAEIWPDIDVKVTL